jgi:hypothetical protein
MIMSQNVQERNSSKQTPAEIKRYLKEQYKKSAQQKIDIEPPKISRNTRLYHKA